MTEMMLRLEVGQTYIVSRGLPIPLYVSTADEFDAARCMYPGDVFVVLRVVRSTSKCRTMNSDVHVLLHGDRVFCTQFRSMMVTLG